MHRLQSIAVYTGRFAGLFWPRIQMALAEIEPSCFYISE